MADRPAILGLVNKALGKESSEQQESEEHQGHKVGGYAKKPKKHFSKKPSGTRDQPGKQTGSGSIGGVQAGQPGKQPVLPSKPTPAPKPPVKKKP